ncbi:MAG TPA: UDP-N-acetylmuramate dehydrogenase [Candidatus Dormibacteraeota bacterium]|nr:UDP-N-acetylmuramate dehydrogenase [Candidatus Dormibacteraeota bacterium]
MSSPLSSTMQWLQRGANPNHSLAPHTTYRIGGAADWYLEVGSGWSTLMRETRERGIPVTLLGNGSNVLVADEGVEGLVVHPTDASIEVRGETVYAGAGARMVKVAQAAAGAGLTGMEWALGIPGMVGGSVRNNAGCFGSDIVSTVVAIHGHDPAGEERTWTTEELAFVYRGSALRDGELAGAVVTAAEFGLAPADAADIKRRMDEIQRQRRLTQPVTKRSTGSVFKNPPGDAAARLIDAAGLKGRTVGGAMVSPEHANFIVNAGNARAADVAELVRIVQATIEDQHGIRLETEIEALGRWPGGIPDAFAGQEHRP